MLKRLLTSFIIITILVLIACGKHKLKGNLSGKERFAIAKEMFDDEDYLDAKTQFRIITLSYQGSSMIDSAQYYLAECHFHLKEYILAAAEYQKLTKMFPHSPLVDDAQYKTGLCDYELSPKYSLDQEFTHKAIRSFQQFLEEYPNSELVPEASQKLHELRTKLAKKEYENGKIYYKMDDYEATIVYFQSVIDTYYDTKFAPQAVFGKAKSLYKLNRLDEAEELFQTFIEKYPKNKLVSKAKKELEAISQKKKEQLNESKNVSKIDAKTDSSEGNHE